MDPLHWGRGLLDPAEVDLRRELLYPLVGWPDEADEVVDYRLLDEDRVEAVDLALEATACAEVDDEVGVPLLDDVLGAGGGVLLAPAAVVDDDLLARYGGGEPLAEGGVVHLSVWEEGGGALHSPSAETMTTMRPISVRDSHAPAGGISVGSMHYLYFGTPIDETRQVSSIGFSTSALAAMVRGWVDFLRKQESPFKVNIIRNFVQRFATNLSYQFQPLFLTSLGASPLILGYLNSLNGVVNTVLAIPTGVAADRVGIKKVLVFTMLLSVASAVVFAFASSWEMAAVALVLSGAVMILDRTVCPMICGSSLASGERLTGMGICDTISFFPQLIAPILGAVLITYFGGMNAEGIRPLFYLQTAFLLVAVAIIQFWFKNPASQCRGRPWERLRGHRRPLQGGEDNQEVASAHRGGGLPLAGGVLHAALRGSGEGGGRLHSRRHERRVDHRLRLLRHTAWAGSATRWGRKKMAAVAAAADDTLLPRARLGAQHLTCCSSPGSSAASACRFTQNLMAISVELVPRTRLGSWVGLQGFCRGLVGIASPIICGYLWSYVFPGSVFYFLAATQVVALAMLILVPTEITR